MVWRRCLRSHRELYQALEWLQPSPVADAEQHQTWLQLQAQLIPLGPNPLPRFKLSETKKLTAGFTGQQLNFDAEVLMSGY